MTAAKLFKLVHWAREALEPQPEIEWVIDALFSPGSVALVVGEGGAKKTYSLLDAGVCVALGVPWLGRATRQGHVLVVDEESGPRRLNRRLAEVIRGHPGADAEIKVGYISLAQVNLRKPEDVEALSFAIKGAKAKLVIIDALADVMPGGDENAVKDVQPVFLALRRIAECTQAAIVVIHHANKGGGYRGSSALKGAVDLLLMVDSKPESLNIDFAIEKARDTEPFKFAAVIHFEVEEGVKRTYLTPSEPANRERPLSASQEFVLRYLADHGQASVSDIIGSADACSPDAARRAIYALVDMDRIYRVNSGGKGAGAIYALKEDAVQQVMQAMVPERSKNGRDRSKQ